MKKVSPNVTVSATSAITATSDHELEYLRNAKRLSVLFFTGYRYIQSPNVRPIAWRTVHEPLANGFVRKYVDPISLVGVGFGANTSYLMGDIDRRSANHPCNNPRNFVRLLATLDRIGLTTPVVIQSSESGGIHIYYFFNRDVNTYRIASLALVTLSDAKFQVKDGELELFPNCKLFDNDKSEHKTDYNRHRLPLQPQGGGQILDRKGNPLMCGVNLNCETQLAAFLSMAKASADGNDLDKIERQLDPVYKIFTKNPTKYRYTYRQKDGESAKFTNWRQDTETTINLGWTGFHQTNALLYDFVVYGITFLKISDENALFRWVFQAVTNTDGYQEFCRHQHEIEARIWDWINYHLKKQTYVPHCDHPPRSTDRDYIIAEYKTSKSRPTSRAEAYTRKRVEQTVERMDQTVKIILATIANIPSRTGDVIKLIQATARQKFGKGFSNKTFYKKHYQYIWDKLIATKKVCNIVPSTPIAPPNMRYCSKTPTESAFERSILGTSDLPKTTLKPSVGETSHPISSLWSVDSSSRLPLAVNEVDPDSDLDLDSENVPPDPDSDSDSHPSLELIESKLPTTFNSLDLDNPLSIQIQVSLDPIEPALKDNLSLDPIDLSTDPIGSQSYDRDKLVAPDSIELAQDDLVSLQSDDRDKLIASDPQEKDLLVDPINSQSSLIPPLPNFDTSYQPDLIEPSGADSTSPPSHARLIPIEPDPIYPAHKKNDRVQLIDIDDREHQSTGVVCAIIGSRAMVKWDVSRKLNTYPIANLKIINPKIPKKLSEAQQIILYAEKSKYLAQLIPYNGCLVITIDAQQVHGWVIAVRDWDVYVNWQDGSSGRYVIEELICIYSPCANNFIEKLIDRSQVPASEF